MSLGEVVIWDFCYVDLLFIGWAGRLNYCFHLLTLSLGQSNSDSWSCDCPSACMQDNVPAQLTWFWLSDLLCH